MHMQWFLRCVKGLKRSFN